MKRFTGNDTEKDRLIHEIIEVEWAMFDKVNNIGGRAGCQDDARTFHIMRYSQFFAFDEKTLQSYRDDLRQAEVTGRNLVAEKYGYMMEYSDPAYFDQNLRDRLPAISPAKEELVDRIVHLQIGFEQQFDCKYPKLYGRSRPLMGQDKNDVSFHLYLIGELKTYSESTLALYYAYLQGIDVDDESCNPSFIIHAKTAEFYGYQTLDAAEAAL